MPEDKNKIEDIKRHLYDREDTTTNRRREGVLHQINHTVQDTWVDDSPKESELNTPMKKPPMSGFKKFFIASIFFFIAAISFAGYMFTHGTSAVTSDRIDIKVLGNAFTKGGDVLPLQIEITNHNTASLELADLVIEYPRGAADSANDMIRLPREIIGTVAPGQSITRSVRVTLFGDEKSTRSVKIRLEYHPAGSNAIFTKEKEYPVTISSAPLSLLIDAPTEATIDQLVTFKITALLNTSLPQGATKLQIAYPNNFVFDSAVPAPSVGNSVWSLDSLSQTTPVVITLKGKFIGQEGDDQVFHVYAGTTSPTDASVVNVVYNSLLQTVKLTKPFLEAHILVQGQDLPVYTVSGGQDIDGDITWVNNLSSRITDAQIIVSLAGNAFDKDSVNAHEGFFDSVKNQIVWDKNSFPDLASVEPGGTGSVSFSFKSISLVGLSSALKSPQVTLDVSIRGRQPTLGSTFSDVNNFAKKIVKVASDFQIAASATFASGSMPPKAEAQTKYTVTWTLSNSANSITGAVARSVLPIYVDWGGSLTGGQETVSYNSVTREVSWNIGSVAPNTGFDSNREASFTVILKPSSSQVGSVPQLMKDVYLSGQDTFTTSVVKNNRGPITTLLTNDPSFKIGNERVIK